MSIALSARPLNLSFVIYLHPSGIGAHETAKGPITSCFLPFIIHSGSCRFYIIGYTDEWCQTDINECDPNPCTAIFDCQNLVNRFECTINTPKLSAIIISSLFIFGFIAFALRRFVFKKGHYKVSQSR